MEYMVIKLDLSHYFGDDGAKAIVLGNTKWGRVRKLIEHIEALFQLKNIQLKTVDDYWIPPQENIEIFKNINVVKVVGRVEIIRQEEIATKEMNVNSRVFSSNNHILQKIIQSEPLEISQAANAKRKIYSIGHCLDSSTPNASKKLKFGPGQMPNGGDHHTNSMKATNFPEESLPIQTVHEDVNVPRSHEGNNTSAEVLQKQTTDILEILTKENKKNTLSESHLSLNESKKNKKKRKKQNGSVNPKQTKMDVYKDEFASLEKTLMKCSMLPQTSFNKRPKTPNKHIFFNEDSNGGQAETLQVTPPSNEKSIRFDFVCPIPNYEKFIMDNTRKESMSLAMAKESLEKSFGISLGTNKINKSNTTLTAGSDSLNSSSTRRERQRIRKRKKQRKSLTNESCPDGALNGSLNMPNGKSLHSESSPDVLDKDPMNSPLKDKTNDSLDSKKTNGNDHVTENGNTNANVDNGNTNETIENSKENTLIMNESIENMTCDMSELEQPEENIRNDFTACDDPELSLTINENSVKTNSLNAAIVDEDISDPLDPSDPSHIENEQSQNTVDDTQNESLQNKKETSECNEENAQLTEQSDKANNENSTKTCTENSSKDFESKNASSFNDEKATENAKESLGDTMDCSLTSDTAEASRVQEDIGNSSLESSALSESLMDSQNSSNYMDESSVIAIETSGSEDETTAENGTLKDSFQLHKSLKIEEILPLSRELTDLPYVGDIILFKLETAKSGKVFELTNYMAAICEYINKRSKAIKVCIIDGIEETSKIALSHFCNLDDTNEKRYLNVKIHNMIDLKIYQG